MKDRIFDSLTIRQYLDGNLDPREMYELEKQSLEDEFLCDALEGYIYAVEPAEKLSILQRQLADRIRVQEANKKTFGMTAHRLSIAAASGVMCVLALILFWMKGYDTPAAPEPVEISLSNRVSDPDLLKNKRAKAGLYRAVAEQLSSRSEPVAGWKEYVKYIQNNIHRPEAPLLKNNVKNIIIAFKINQSGSPVDLKLVDGISDTYSDQAIRVIKNGPLWKALDDEEVKVRINFRK